MVAQDPAPDRLLEGLHVGSREVGFDPEGFPDPGYEFGCKAKIAGAFTAVGIILKTLLGG